MSASPFDSGGFDDFAPAPANKPFAGLMSSGVRGPRPHDPGSGQVRDRPPPWVPDGVVSMCSAGCGRNFEMFERRHHCRYCGKIFCAACSSTSRLMPPQWEGLCGFATRDPQRCCDNCAMELGPRDRAGASDLESSRPRRGAPRGYSEGMGRGPAAGRRADIPRAGRGVPRGHSEGGSRPRRGVPRGHSEGGAPPRGATGPPKFR